MSIRKDEFKIFIQDNIYLLVFHKIHNEGKGSAVSLYIDDFEFIKFDCFGNTLGHYHIFYKTYNDMIYFTEKTAYDQIDKTGFELLNNINYYIQKSDIPSIKKLDTKIKINESLINLMIQKMKTYEDQYYKDSR